MRRAKLTIAFVIAAAALRAQDLQDVLQRGEEVFGKTCAAGYCHGSKGAVAAGAPRLAARGFTQAYITNTIAQGVPGTSMPAFGTSLPASDRVAVAAYLATLNGVANPNIAGALAAPTVAAPQLAPEAARGRELFSDATRGFARCSTCHEVNRIGISVTTPIFTLPTDVAALKSLATPGVSTAQRRWRFHTGPNGRAPGSVGHVLRLDGRSPGTPHRRSRHDPNTRRQFLETSLA